MTKIAAALGSLALAGTIGGILWAQSASQSERQAAITPGGGPLVTMDYRDFADVQSPRSPSVPLRIVTSQAADGRPTTTFSVAAPWHGLPLGMTFRDGAHIAADGAAHKGQPAKLSAEFHAWTLLLKDSPVIITQADLEPQCKAHLSGPGGAIPAISQTFTPTGTEKIARFTKDHTEGMIGLIVDGRVLSAPIIRAPILGGKGEISGGFASLSEARVLADGLNKAAGGGRRH